MSSKKPLIAILSNHDDDIYCFRKELLEELLNVGYDVLISCPDGPKLRLMELDKYIYDDTTIDRRGTNPVTDTKLILHYFRLLKKYRPDIVLTFTVKPNVYGGFASHLCGIPFIANVTGFGSLLFEQGIKQKFIIGLYRNVLRRAGCLMFQNKVNCDLAASWGMIKGDHKIIPGSGVNVDRFALSDYPDGGDGKNGDPVIFNYIGRIVHDKGVDDFIDAAKIIKKEYPKTEFNMMGFIEPTEAHYESDLNKLEKQNILHYLGSQNDVRPFISRSHCTIHPSFGEGMCNSLLETASTGRPIITTDVQGCADTVIDNKSGFVYPCRDVNALTAKIRRFLEMPNDDRKEMGIHGRRFMENYFSRNIVIREYLDTIKSLGGEK